VLRFTVTGAWLDIDYFTFVKGKDATDPEPIGTDLANAVRLDVQGARTYRVYGLDGSFLGRISAKNAAEVQQQVRTVVKPKGAFYVRPVR
jgi:hypothetical protein